MTPVGSRKYFHCDHCNNFEFPEETGDGVSVVGDPSGVDCPVCANPLKNAVIEGEQIAYCNKCRGFLTPIRTFGAIVNKRRALHGKNEERFTPIDPAELKRVLKCPSCHRRMDAHPFHGGGAAVVDTCEACALIWLDAGELAIIERHIPREIPRVPPPAAPVATTTPNAEDDDNILSTIWDLIPNDPFGP
jgi:Zn-finger nucleic acid-binding protein